MNLVFFAFRDSLFRASQSTIFSSSLLISFASLFLFLGFGWANVQMGSINVVSSAYIVNLNLFVIFAISFMYMIKSKGPKIDPWGTTSYKNVLKFQFAMWRGIYHDFPRSHSMTLMCLLYLQQWRGCKLRCVC